MNVFGPTSKFVYRQLHPHLQMFADMLLAKKNVSLISGYRGKAEQDKYFREGTSKAEFGASPHNYWPALAFDVVPWPTQFDNATELAVMGGIVIGLDHGLDFDVTWGADWDNDGDTFDHQFRDSPHVQLRDWKDIVRNPNGLYYKQYLDNGVKYF